MQTNLLVAKHRAKRFAIEGAVVADLAVGDVAYISLEDSDRGRVRGHSECIWPIDDVRGAGKEFARQCKEREPGANRRRHEPQGASAA